MCHVSVAMTRKKEVVPSGIDGENTKNRDRGLGVHSQSVERSRASARG